MPDLLVRSFLLLATLAAVLGGTGLPETLTDADRVQAIALGRTCQSPIVQVSREGGDFDVYIESPYARVALVAAAAQVMQQSIDAPGVRLAMKPGYRIWLHRTPRARIDYTVTQVYVRSGDHDFSPVSESRDRFFLGTVPSHGMVEAVRSRIPEYSFDALPAGNFDVVVETSAGPQHYPVKQRDRQKLMRVCNDPR